MTLDGYELIACEYCGKRVQARVHKKKRINKKWRKRYGFRYVDNGQLVIFDRKIYGHPKRIEKIIKEIKKKTKEESVRESAES